MQCLERISYALLIVMWRDSLYMPPDKENSLKKTKYSYKYLKYKLILFISPNIFLFKDNLQIFYWDITYVVKSINLNCTVLWPLTMCMVDTKLSNYRVFLTPEIPFVPSQSIFLREDSILVCLYRLVVPNLQI